MENNKNPMATGMLAGIVLAAIFLVGLLIFGNPHVDVTDPEKVAKKQATAAKGADAVAQQPQDTQIKSGQEVSGVNAIRQSSHWKDLQSLLFPENYPTKETADRLYDEMLFQRASLVVLWSLPAMALWAMKKGSEAQFGEGSNVFPIWKDRLSAETLVSTPNSDVIYGMGYLDLKMDGPPTVIEVPPKLQGILDDFWHRPLTDVGFVGPDKGEGWQLPDLAA